MFAMHIAAILGTLKGLWQLTGGFLRPYLLFCLPLYAEEGMALQQRITELEKFDNRVIGGMSVLVVIFAITAATLIGMNRWYHSSIVSLKVDGAKLRSDVRSNGKRLDGLITEQARCRNDVLNRLMDVTK